ncbi:unnamed protein product [Closterium sp. NIES-54]
MSSAKPASRLQSVGVGLLAIIAAFLLFWPGPGDVPRRRLAIKPLNKAQIFKSPFKGFSKGVQDMINKLKQRDRTMAKFVGNSVETMPINVNMTQRGVLLALKKAWGGNFYQSETWVESAQAELWWGVTINEFGSVTALELPRAEITGPLPMLLTKLTGLTALDLRGNHLRGSIPKGLLAALPGLQSLYLSDNNLVGEFPLNEVFRKPVVPMTMLQIDGNVFTGTIADDVFANATSLQSLGLSSNKFSGAIPSSLGNCRQISAIDLSDNQFTGQIPGSIAGLPALSIFDVGQNKLSGVIPDFLGNFPNMMNLDLSNNQFYGVVPATFSKFGQTLRAVKLANNFLTGQLPQFPNLGQGCGSPGPDGSDSISCYINMSEAVAEQAPHVVDAAQESEDEEETFESIEKLITQGINAGDVKKLQDAGVYTCNGLMMWTKKALCDIKGLSDAKVEKILEAAGKLVALDDLLGGGVETMAITEAFGEFRFTPSRTGKTQLAHTLCVATQLPINMKGGNGKVAFIDTEGTFRPERIVPIAERFGLDPNAVLDNIIFARAYTHEHQYQLLIALAAKMAEEPFKLLIIDSITALFRVDFTGRGELAERQISEEFNVAVFLTNQVIADPGGGTFVADPKKPAGGHVMAHASTVRLMFRKGKGEQRICKVIDSPNLPESEATFAIANGGVIDAKD